MSITARSAGGSSIMRRRWRSGCSEIQSRGHLAATVIAERVSSGNGYLALGRLVQPPPPLRTHRAHSAPRPRPTAMQPTKPSIWRHDPNETASENPGRFNPLEHAFVMKPSKPAVDRLPRRKVLGQQASCNPAAQHIENRIHNLARRPFPPPAGRMRLAQKCRNQHPPGVAQIRLVTLRNPRMLRTGGRGLHQDFRVVCNTPQ